MRISRQNDKLKQWVMHRAVKHDVLGSILGCQKQNFFSLFNSHYYTTYAFLSVSLLISLQFTAETHLTKHIPMKQYKTVRLKETTCSIKT